MNSHDKIMLGLSCHAKSKCSKCPYEDMPECSSKLALDAAKLLEVAMEDLENGVGCDTCMHCNADAKLPPCATCLDSYAHGNWQWRGVEVE